MVIRGRMRVSERSITLEHATAAAPVSQENSPESCFMPAAKGNDPHAEFRERGIRGAVMLRRGMSSRGDVG